MQVRSQGPEDPLEKEIATHSSILQSSRLKNPHGQRSLVGHNPYGFKELDMTERLSIHTAQADLTFLLCKTRAELNDFPV